MEFDENERCSIRFTEYLAMGSQIKELEAEVARLTADKDTARRTSEYWKAEHLAGNGQIARLREALKELLESYLSTMPLFEAGKEAQDAWADRRAKARNDAGALLNAPLAKICPKCKRIVTEGCSYCACPYPLPESTVPNSGAEHPEVVHDRTKDPERWS